ncbi:hypothetical protein JSO54_00190 [Riemerella anatipestifer]|uniref:DUF6705 family protein n=1 Tax=Riemerella anatipestifer TaxID=34085 RepID=UPI0030C0AF5B
MKKIILSYLLTVFLVNMSYTQEVVGTLKQFEECSKRANYQSEGCPDLENITYIKDVGNRLDKFVGIWEGTYNGKIYTFKFNKRTRYGDDKGDRVRDLLFGRMKVQTSNGKVIYNTLSESDDDKTYFFGKNFQRNTYMMNLIINTACNDSGVVFMEVYSKQPNKMRLYMDRDKIWYNPERCPNYETYEVTIPNEEIILTKQ